MSKFKKISATELSLSRRTLVYGVGTNDAWYKTEIRLDGKRLVCHAYLSWVNMLKRCYSPKFHETRPTYKGCSVCGDWMVFSCFEKWFNENYIDGHALDKDIKEKGNKVYSPEKCLYVTRSLNNLFCDSSSIRGEYPVGVYKIKRSGKFCAAVYVNGMKKFIGNFNSQEDASSAYEIEKSNEIKRQCELHPEIAPYLINHLPENRRII